MAFDVHEALRELREELDRITAVIAALEKLANANDRVSKERPRKQGSMSSGTH
jgi:uncharacterized protein YigA (DUF484 family)